MIHDDKNKTFVVRNRNTDAFNKEFEEFYNDLCDVGMLCHEIAYQISSMIETPSFKLLQVFDASNEYNTSQAEINKLKAIETNRMLAQGWVEDPTLDEVAKNVYLNSENLEAFYKRHDYKVIMNEAFEEDKAKVEALKKEKDELDDKVSTLKYYMQSLQKRSIDLEKQRDTLKDEIEYAKQTYNSDIATLESEYDKLSLKYDALETEFKSKYEEKLVEYGKMTKKLDDDISVKESALKRLNTEWSDKKEKLFEAVGPKIEELQELESKIKQYKIWEKTYMDAEMLHDFCEEFGHGLRDFRTHKDEILKILK